MFRLLIRVALCWPAALVGLIFARLVSGINPKIVKTPDAVVVIFNPKSIAAKVWPFATTLGYVIIAHPKFDAEHEFTPMLIHERVHIRQFESVCSGWFLASAVVSIVDWRSALFMAAFSPLCWLIFYVGASIIAWTHQDDAYRGNVFEMHAYLHEDTVRQHRKSW